MVQDLYPGSFSTAAYWDTHSPRPWSRRSNEPGEPGEQIRVCMTMMKSDPADECYRPGTTGDTGDRYGIWPRVPIIIGIFEQTNQYSLCDA